MDDPTTGRITRVTGGDIISESFVMGKPFSTRREPVTLTVEIPAEYLHRIDINRPITITQEPQEG